VRNKPLRILVADDSPTNRKLLRVLLETEGHRVLEAADGVEALAVLRVEPVDVVVSDILMPRMDGYRFCLELRRSKLSRRVPLLFYTGTYTSAADEKAAMDLGADKFLRKPAPAKAVLDAMREALANARSRGPARKNCGTAVMKEYSEVLVAKLEHKNQELEKQTRSLRESQARIRKLNDELEARVRRRTAQLENANRELEAFAYSVSHDLRSPLRQIEGFSDLLVSSADDGSRNQSKHCLDSIRERTRRMGRLIDDLLEFAQIGRVQMHRTQVDLQAVANDVLNEIQSSREATGRNIEWKFARLPGVIGDPALLRQVLANLLNNAVKYSSPRKLATIEVAARETEDEWIIFIRDNGVGFDEKYAAKLFGAFERLHPESGFAGSGLGLSSVRRIIERHAGRTWAEGRVNAGATFYFSLPKPYGSAGHG
jgi:signal transduction histidine kinase